MLSSKKKAIAFVAVLIFGSFLVVWHQTLNLQNDFIARAVGNWNAIFCLVMAIVLNAGLQQRQQEIDTRLLHTMVGFIFFVLLILFFACFYKTMTGAFEVDKAQAFSSYQDALYFSAVTQTTLGYGEIFPKSRDAKAVVITQSALALLVVPLIASQLIDLFKLEK